MQALTKKLAAKVLAVVDAGLVIGIGTPVPGQMCVEAAVCYAYGLPHSDRPPCVGVAVCSLKIALNDNFQGTNQERAKLLRRIAIAQLGSDQIDQVEFAIRVALLVYQGPQFVQWANNWLSGKDRTVDSAAYAARAAYAADAEAAAAARAAYAAAEAAADAAYAAATYAAYAAYAVEAAARAARAARAEAAAKAAAKAAEAATYAAAAAKAAAKAAEAATYAADAARAEAAAEAAKAEAEASDAAAEAAADAAYAASADFEKFTKQVVQILIEMRAPGTKYLYLTERENHVSQ